MLRSTLLAVVAGFAVGLPDPHIPVRPDRGVASPDLRVLMSQAIGAPPLICALAARAVSNLGWRGADRPPIRPLGTTSSEGWGGDGTLEPEEVQYLIEQLVQPDPCSRELAIRLLARDGSSDATRGLARQLTATDADLRAAAALGLGLIGDSTTTLALVAVTRDAASAPRTNAVWALGRIRDGRGFAAAHRALEDPDPMIRDAAAEALGQFDSTAAIAALMRRLRQDDAASVRRTAAWALAQLDAMQASSALADALQSDADASVREMSAWALGNIEHSDGITALTEALRRDASAPVREMAAWALGELEAESASAVLGEAVTGDRSADVRATSAWALGQLEPERAPRGLISAVGDADANVRLNAAWALSEIGDSAALPALRTALQRESGDRARRAMLRAVIRSGEGVERLAEMFTSPNVRDREMVTRALAGRPHLDPWPWPMPRPRPFP